MDMKSLKKMCLIALLLPVTLQTVLADEQGWLNNSLSLTISPKLSFKFTQEIRHNELTLSDAYLSNWSGGLSYALGSHFTVGFAYLRETTHRSSADLQENRYSLETGWKTSLAKGWNLDARLRGEIRIYENDLSDDHLRLRLRLRLVHSMVIGKLSVKPFLAIEPFYNAKKSEFSSNRIYAGLTVPLNKQFDWAVNYIYQGNKGKDPYHIFNTGFDLKF